MVINNIPVWIPWALKKPVLLTINKLNHLENKNQLRLILNLTF